MSAQSFTKLDVFFLWTILLVSLTTVQLSISNRHQQQQQQHQAVSDHHSDSDVQTESDAEVFSSRRLFRRSVPGTSEAGRGTDDETSSPEPDADSSGPSNCSHCSTRQGKRNYRLEAIKVDILRKLRLSSPPNITGKRLPDIPQIRNIIEGHRLQNPFVDDNSTGSTRGPPAEDSDDSFATTLKYVLFAQPAPEIVAGNASNFFHFQFQSEMAHQQIVNASINIYVRRTTNPGLSATWLLLYEYGPLSTDPTVSQQRDNFRRRRVNMSSLFYEGQWFSFEIKPSVERWISHQNLSYGLLVQVSDGRGEPLAVVNPQTPEEMDRKPYLMIHVRDQGTSRPRRTLISDCDENGAERRCCRYPLTVDFEQFSWDWVIVPKRYPAYYCSGECQFLYYQNNPHTGIVQQAQKLSGTAGGPCCSPRKVSAISMLYYDDNMNIVYGRLPGMVVDQCGCS